MQRVHLGFRHENAVLHALEHCDGIVAAASCCPVLECGSLVVDYRPAYSVRPGHPEDWEFACPRCGIKFTVTQGDLIFQAGTKQWLMANIHAA